MEDSTKIKTVRYALKDLNPQDEEEHKKRQQSQNSRSSEADEQETRR